MTCTHFKCRVATYVYMQLQDSLMYACKFVCRMYLRAEQADVLVHLELVQIATLQHSMSTI